MTRQTKDDIRPFTHKKEASAPKAPHGHDDGTRWKVIDDKDPTRTFGSGLKHVDARKLASRLSSSHTCRTAKIVEDTTSAKAPRMVPVTASVASSGKRTVNPPSPLLAMAGAAAMGAAAEAQARHDAHVAKQKAEEELRQRAADAAAQLAEGLNEEVGDIMGEADDGGAEIDGLLPDAMPDAHE